MTNRILTINKTTDTFWLQLSPTNFQVGRYSLAPDTLLNDARSNGAIIFDISKIKPDVMSRLRKKFWNGRGATDDPDLFIEALRLNKAKVIK